ncbi:hypothetical protein ncot_18135 [Nocardioides sp. JQ2195]|uniref:hypothetical protein n=1 Tax=Nocardioides sp. JQ2195 TaxID=2592334 RepID=UPI00143E74FB|nr:hypothetical protein [Nocardioides sp. JQ2195]QIX28295.1 hypothetical protein ncot_18135 [Nocardioides sp. JQ2195]
MPTIDLSTPSPAAEGTLEGLPRRLALTLPELRLLAEQAGGAPLPFEIVTPGSGASALESRLGQSRTASEDQAYADALATLHDPAEALAKRGLIVDGRADAGVVGALGLLAKPAVAVDIDLNIDGIRAKAWHRQREGAVATLATTDGVVFELAWFESPHWSAELGRVPTLPEDHVTEESTVPEVIDLPYELLDAGGEAVRSGRVDLLGTIVAHHTGGVLDAAGESIDDSTVTSLVSALVGETRGRLRALVADIDAGGDVVGVVSWVLLADGWRTLRAHQVGDVNRVEVRRVEAAELAATLSPVLAEVTA